ncbi:MAG TPA: hypothetical protein VHN20_10850 [Beijerinckiaceae bacterium]|nr:hypothetical protein [Beijerinckiaceae bacterium]
MRAALLCLACTAGLSIAHGQQAGKPPDSWAGARRPLSAAEKYGPYGSVGTITCRRPADAKRKEVYWHGTGQVTLAQDVVTTAAHNFIDPDTCKPFGPEWTCWFRAPFRSYALDYSRSRFGWSLRPADWADQAAAPGRCKTEKSVFAKDDWAVLKLAEKVKDAVPFAIDEMRKEEVIKTGAPLVMIAGYTPAFLKDGQETFSIEKCTQHGASPRGGTRELPLLLADCSGGQGTSGSGLYRLGSNGPGSERLIAIYHGPLILPARRIALYVPISGEFLIQLKQVAGQ